MSCDLITSHSTCCIFGATVDRVNLNSVPETRENIPWKEKKKLLFLVLQVQKKAYHCNLIFYNFRETLFIFAPNGNIWGHVTPMTSQMVLHAHK